MMIHPPSLALALVSTATFVVASAVRAPERYIRGDVQHRAAAPTYSATYLPYNAPKHSEDGQYGTNACGTTSSQDSLCQNAYVNAVDDFCVWAPPANKSSYGDSSIANTERIEVSWCLRSGYGTRVMPEGTIKGAHFIQTPLYVQITGIGDLTKLNIPKGDDGGELDPHGYDGNGNPIGGLVFGDSYNGTLRQYHEWTNFMGSDFFCFRACIDGPEATKYCGHIWDTLGCGWNMPGDYSDGFTSCEGDPTDPMGIYVNNGVTSTFHQGDPSTPPAHVAGKSSSCTTYAALTSAGSPAVSPTASLLPASILQSLSVASAMSVSSVSVISTSSAAGQTSITSTRSGTGSGTATQTGVSSSSGAARARARLGKTGTMDVIHAFVGAFGGLLLGGWLVARL